MRLVVSQPKKRKNYEIGYLKKLIWYGKIWTFLEGSSLNIFVLHTWLHSFWCLTFQLFKYSLHSPDLLLHLTSFTFFHSHGLSSHHSVLCFPFFFFYRAYSNFLLHLLLCLFLLNEWSLHVTNFVVLWFSSHSLSLSLKIHENKEKVQDIQQCLIPVCNTIFGRNGKISPRTGQNLGWHRTWGSPAPVCPPERKIPAIPARTKWNSKLCHNLPVLLYFYFYFFIIFSPWISNPPCFFLLFYFFPFGNLPSTNYHIAMSSYS